MRRLSIPLLAAAFGLASISAVAAQGYGTGQQQQRGSQGYGSGQQQQQPGAGGQRQSSGINEDQARRMLQARGYSNVQDLEKDGNQYTASAERGGREVDVVVDARNGQVRESAN